LHRHDAEHLLHDIAKPRPDGPRALVLTPLELINKVAALVPTRPLGRAPARGPPLREARAQFWVRATYGRVVEFAIL
jgi:hypothetical protein